MAAFTMYLHEVCEFTDNHIGLDSYPIFDEDYRDGLNQKIIDHYWNREIGQETIEMFTFAMKRKMNEVMPYFNQLYESTRLEYDPLSTVKIRTIVDGTANETGESNRVDNGTVAVSGQGTANSETTAEGTSENDGTSNTTDSRDTVTSSDTTTSRNSEVDSTHDESSRGVSSDYPQMMLSGSTDYASSGADATGKSSDNSVTTESGTEGVDGTEGVEGVSNTTTHDEGSTTNHSVTDETTTDTRDTISNDNSDVTDTRDRVEHNDQSVSGYNQHTVDMIMRYRESLLNIDMLIIDVLADLFMLLWDTSDSYTGRGYFYAY